MAEGRFCSLFPHSSSAQFWTNYRTTKHSSKHRAVGNQQNGWKKNTRKFQRENARSRRCCYFDTEQISLQKRRARQSFEWFFQLWLQAEACSLYLLNLYFLPLYQENLILKGNQSISFRAQWIQVVFYTVYQSSSISLLYRIITQCNMRIQVLYVNTYNSCSPN